MRPSKKHGIGWEVFSSSEKGREALPEEREGLRAPEGTGGPPIGSVEVGTSSQGSRRPSRRSGRGRNILAEVW